MMAVAIIGRPPLADAEDRATGSVDVFAAGDAARGEPDGVRQFDNEGGVQSAK